MRTKLIAGLLALTLLCAALPATAEQYTGPGSAGDDAVWLPLTDWIQSLVRAWTIWMEGGRVPELAQSASSPGGG